MVSVLNAPVSYDREVLIQANKKTAERMIQAAMKGLAIDNIRTVAAPDLERVHRNPQWQQTGGYTYVSPDGLTKIMVLELKPSLEKTARARYFLRVAREEVPTGIGDLKYSGRTLDGRQAQKVFRKLQRAHRKK